MASNVENTEEKTSFPSNEHIQQLESQLKEALKKGKLTEDQLQEEKEEVKRLITLLEHREIEYRLKLHSSVDEVMNLRERLGKHFDKQQSKTLNVFTNSILTRRKSTSTVRTPGKSSNSTNINSARDDFYKYIVDKTEVRQKKLLTENLNLRETLLIIHLELLSTAEHLQQVVKNLNDTSGDTDYQFEEFEPQPSIESGYYQLTYHEIRSTVEKTVQQLNNQIKTLVNSGILNKDESLERNVKILGEEVRTHTQTIENVIAKGISVQDEPIVRDAYFLEEKEQLRIKEEQLKTQMDEMKKLRQHLTDIIAQNEQQNEIYKSKKQEFLDGLERSFPGLGYSSESECDSTKCTRETQKKSKGKSHA